MNYLAHIYLSEENELVKIGNFMADGIRGNKYLDYPKDIQKGIILHRAIDTFTDAHPIFRKSKHLLHERYGHYSGVIIDIFYDHFLAKNWHQYSNVKLEDYAQEFYNSLKNNYSLLSDKTKKLYPYMIKNDWLTSYATLDGIGLILFQMDYRTKNQSKMQYSVEELKKYYFDFETEFTLFFKELKVYCQNKLQEL